MVGISISNYKFSGVVRSHHIVKLCEYKAWLHILSQNHHQKFNYKASNYHNSCTIKYIVASI